MHLSVDRPRATSAVRQTATWPGGGRCHCRVKAGCCRPTVSLPVGLIWRRATAGKQCKGNEQNLPRDMSGYRSAPSGGQLPLRETGGHRGGHRQRTVCRCRSSISVCPAARQRSTGTESSPGVGTEPRAPPRRARSRSSWALLVWPCWWLAVRGLHWWLMRDGGGSWCGLTWLKPRLSGSYCHSVLGTSGKFAGYAVHALTASHRAHDENKGFVRGTGTERALQEIAHLCRSGYSSVPPAVSLWSTSTSYTNREHHSLARRDHGC